MKMYLVLSPNQLYKILVGAMTKQVSSFKPLRLEVFNFCELD